MNPATDPFVTTHHVRVPNYGHEDYDGGTQMFIPHRHTEFLGNLDVDVLAIAGECMVSSGARIRAKTILVYPGGKLLIGTPSTPATDVEIIIGGGEIDTEFDPEQYGHGLLVFGEFRAYGREKTPFVRQDDSQAGTPSGWMLNDEVFIPDSSQDASRPSIIKLWKDTRWGDLIDDVEFPHVANLIRSIVIRSADNGVRGHCLATGRAAIDLNGVRFDRLGRTNNDEFIDAAEYDESTGKWRSGDNQPGRYQWHFHHCYGPESHVIVDKQIGHKQGRINNCVFTSERWQKWPLTIHGTSDMLVSGVVVIGGGGLGICFEDRGGEIRNRIEGNFVADISSAQDKDIRGKHDQPGGRPDGPNSWAWQRAGSGIGGGPGNDYIDNVIVGCRKRAGLELWGDRDGPGNVSMRFPLYPGADLMMGKEGEDWESIDLGAVPWGECRGNEIYACRQAIQSWYLGFGGYFNPHPQAPPGEIVDTTCWNVEQPLLLSQIGNVTVVRFVDVNGLHWSFIPRAKDLVFDGCKLPSGWRWAKAAEGVEPGPVTFIDSDTGEDPGPEPEPEPDPVTFEQVLEALVDVETSTTEKLLAIIDMVEKMQDQNVG